MSESKPKRTSRASRRISSLLASPFSGCARLLGVSRSRTNIEDSPSYRPEETKSNGADSHHLAPKTSTPPKILDDQLAVPYANFAHAYPEYRLTHALDHLRHHDYTRLERSKEVYVDYMGGSIYPESLVEQHSELLRNSTYGNTHSISSTSARSAASADAARSAVLNFFDAGDDYTVVFTANASNALKLVGESFPFTSTSHYVLAEDSHNSVHGIRRYAAQADAEVAYIPATSTGGFVRSAAEELLRSRAPKSPQDGPSLFAMTGLSNITNSKGPFNLLAYASELGYATLLDAAALVATSRISLASSSVDAMAVSFYKMFGYPTGVGALVAKKTFLKSLRRPWFSGGNVNVVQSPGVAYKATENIHERFEDGTINYLSLPAIPIGLRLLEDYMPVLLPRLSSLLHYVVQSLQTISHPVNGSPVVHVLSHVPEERVTKVGQTSSAGFIVSFTLFDPSSKPLPLDFIAHASASRNISLRTGCMCNPGGSVALLGLQAPMAQLSNEPEVSMATLERLVGHRLGVVRVSLGLASNFEDAWRVVEFVRDMADERKRTVMRDAWRMSPSFAAYKESFGDV